MPEEVLGKVKGEFLKPKTEELIMDAEPANLHALKEFIVIWAGQYGFEKSYCDRIELVCDELLTNSINYGYKDSSGKIIVQCKTDVENQFQVNILDTGISFDPLSISPPDLTLGVEERGIGGLGVFLSKTIADELRYKRQEPYNIITAVFYKK
jgi:serine/threonine-protein kinase RsbW